MNLARVMLLFALAASGLLGPTRILAYSLVAEQSEPDKSPQGASPQDAQPPSDPNAQSQPAQPPSDPNAQPQPAEPESPPPSQPEAPAATTPTPQPPTATPASSVPASGAQPAKSQKCRKSKSGKCLKNTAAGGPRRKVVVRNGSTSEPTTKLAPTVPTDVASQQAQVTEQLLSAAENNLKQAGTRQLNADQTAVAEQIRNYIEQSRAASKSGDVQRGHNLAVKARLLSDDLVAH